VGPITVLTPPSGATASSDGAGHSVHDAYHLIRWLDDPPLSADGLAAIKVPIMILAGELDQVSVRHTTLSTALVDSPPSHTQISPLSAAEAWRDAFTGGQSTTSSSSLAPSRCAPLRGVALTALVSRLSLYNAAPGGAQLHVVKSAPHLLMYAEAEAANRLVFEFLTSELRLRTDELPHLADLRLDEW